MARAADRHDSRARMVWSCGRWRRVSYYGELKLAAGHPSRDLLAGFGVLVRQVLGLGLVVGDRVALGSQAFTIRGVIERAGRQLGARLSRGCSWTPPTSKTGRSPGSRVSTRFVNEEARSRLVAERKDFANGCVRS
jgi:hypothetical protein